MTLTVHSVEKEPLAATQFIMNIVWLFYGILIHDWIRDVQPAEKSSTWIDSLIKHVREITNPQQVTFVSNTKKQVSGGPVLDELFSKLEMFPILLTNVAELNKSRKSIFNRAIEDETFYDSSATFFIFIHHFYQSFGTLPSEKTVDILLEVSATKVDSQFLLILFSLKLNDNLKEFLKYAWARKLLDFTVVEFLMSKSSKTTINAGFELDIPIVHYYNPFKKVYTRRKWTLGTELFPRKLLNMWGYPIKVATIHRPPFALVKYNKFLEPISVGGSNINLLNIIAEKANFTIKYLPNIHKFQEISSANNPTGLFNLMQSGKVDIMAHLTPHLSKSMRNNSLRTVSIRLIQFCTIVPILPRVALPMSLDFFQAYFVYFGIVITFWASSCVLRFKSRFWYPFNIARALLGISAPHQPTGLSERTLYACMLLVSGIFASSIYTVITNISLQTNAEMEFTSFHDLDESNLVPIINNYIYDKTFDNNDKFLMRLKKKVVIVNESILTNCIFASARNKNVSCLARNDEAETAVKMSARAGDPRVKFTEPCFWSDSVSFPLGKGFPYRSRVDTVIILLRDTGFLEKCYQDGTHTIWDDLNHEDDNDSGLNTRENMKSLRRQLYAIAIIGYTLSLLTFIGEIVVDQILKCKLIAFTICTAKPSPAGVTEGNPRRTYGLKLNETPN